MCGPQRMDTASQNQMLYIRDLLRINPLDSNLFWTKLLSMINVILHFNNNSLRSFNGEHLWACIPSVQHAFHLYVCVCRCQTHPCDECEYQGQSHAVGDRWRSDPCQLCHCLPNLTVQCSPYCPYAVTGCPQVREELCLCVCVMGISCIWCLFLYLWKYGAVHRCICSLFFLDLSM